jgi:selenocysteine lyase/cysteine desulfurase
MSPLLQSVEQAGMEGLARKRNPQTIGPDDFFKDAEIVRSLFARLVHTQTERIAVIPSASYGLGIVARNIKAQPGGKVVTIHEEFVSDVYTLHRICEEHRLQLVTVTPPVATHERGKTWNERILEAITPGTVLVNLSTVHWADGTIFNLEAIGKRVKEVGALFVVDGTQSVGAMEIDVEKNHIDALICACYKWLMGPYTSGLAYFGEYFDEGKPIEETWLNRLGSENFSDLTNYQPRYRAKAARYNMGEYSNFINLPMVKAALQQLLEWTPQAVYDYCTQLSTPLIHHLTNNGFWLEEDTYRASHLFGFRLPEHITMETVQQKLAARKVVVSRRGSALRVSAHVYNNEEDMAALVDCMRL